MSTREQESKRARELVWVRRESASPGFQGEGAGQIAADAALQNFVATHERW